MMISKEHFKKVETQSDAVVRENDARRWRKRRKLYFPCLNSSDTENSDSIGDFKTCVKQKPSNDEFKKKATSPMQSNSRSLVSNASRITDDGFLNTNKFIEDKTRSNKIRATAPEDELTSFNLFMPNVFKRAVNKQPSKGNFLNEARSSTSKHKANSTTYEQLGLAKKLERRIKNEKKPSTGGGGNEVKSSRSVRDAAQKKDDSALGKLANSIMPSVTGGTRPWMQFCRNAQKALAVLNDEVSTALRDSFCSIDDIQLRIRRTMDEIRECDKMYEHLRLRQQSNPSPESQSAPHLPKSEESGTNVENEDEKLLKALGIIQTRSETQMRVAPLPSIAESIYETEMDNHKEVDDSEDAEEQSEHKIEEATEDEKEPSTESSPPATREKVVESVENETDLRRKQGQWNLHNKIMRDLEANDVVLEVEQRVNRDREAEQQANRDRTSRDREAEHRASREAEQRPNQREIEQRRAKALQQIKPMIQIVAEELFVPEKVNRIASTNLNNLPIDATKNKKKACQFLYREKAKKRIVKIVESDTKKSSTSIKGQTKFADSVLFAKRDKKLNFSGDQACGLMIDSITQSDMKHSKQEFKTMTVQSVNYKTGLDCFDILDEITLNDLKPLESEYPRKDNVGTPPVPKPQSSYLYKLVYGTSQDEFLKLLRMEEPSIHCADNCEKCSKILEKCKVTDLPKMEVKRMSGNEAIIKSSSNVRKPQSRKLIKKDNASDIILGKAGGSGKQKRSKKNAHEDIVSRLKPYMFDPHMRYPTTITVMPAMITTYTNPLFIKNVNKALAERNQVGDYSTGGVTRYTSKLNKPPKPLNKSASNIDKKKICASKPAARPPNVRPKFVLQEKMRGDAWDDNETPPAVPSNPKVIKRRNLRSGYESFPTLAAFKQQYADTNKLKQHKVPKQNTWESNIQNVIEMIESKIVEILADPEKAHLEAFKSVETKILEILNSENNLDIIEERSVGEPEGKFLRSKTTDNLKKFKEKKNELRSKTDISLINYKRSSHYPFGRSECRKKQTRSARELKAPSSELLEFLDSLSSVVSDQMVHYTIKKIFYQRSFKIPNYMFFSQVYYQITNFGTYTKRLNDRGPPTPRQQHRPKQSSARSMKPILTASTHTYKIVTATSSGRKLVPTRRPTVTRYKEEEERPTCLPITETICLQLSESIVYNKILNYLYATLFTIIFFGLTFNYTCQ